MTDIFEKDYFEVGDRVRAWLGGDEFINGKIIEIFGDDTRISYKTYRILVESENEIYNVYGTLGMEKI